MHVYTYEGANSLESKDFVCETTEF